MTVGLLLLFSIICAVSNNLLLHKFGNRGLESTGDVLLFNSLCSTVWILLITVISALGSGFRFSRESLFWGILYGIVIAAFLLCKMQAMSSGPVSLTSFIGCSSLLISTGFGVFVLDEGMSVVQGIGVAVLIFALWLIVAPKTESAKKSWKLSCGAFFVCSAATGIVFKLHQRSAAAELVNEMLIVAASVSMLLLAAAAIGFAKLRDKRMPCVPKNAVPYVIACGVAGCLYNRLNVTLSGELPSVVFFPIFNGAVILLSTLSGVFLFGEKLKRGQIEGLAIGFTALLFASGSIDRVLEILI